MPYSFTMPSARAWIWVSSNPATSVLYTDIPADILERIEDVVLNRRPDAAERLIETAERLKAEAEAAKTSGGERQAAAHSQLAWREETSVEERLKYALTKGIGDYLEADLAEALKLYPKAVSIIEGPLMAGMNHVGDLFGAGKMFLPQVVKTARHHEESGCHPPAHNRVGERRRCNCCRKGVVGYGKR